MTGVLFFVALLLNELAHSLLAKARGLHVRAITLFALGGVSEIDEASDAKAEFWIAIAGPITSVASLFWQSLGSLAGYPVPSRLRPPLPCCSGSDTSTSCWPRST